MILKRLILWFRFKVLSKFSERPTSLSWTIEDFEKLEKWAKLQPHPHSKSMCLWDYLYDKDSVWTLTNARNYIKL